MKILLLIVIIGSLSLVAKEENTCHFETIHLKELPVGLKSDGGFGLSINCTDDEGQKYQASFINSKLGKFFMSEVDGKSDRNKKMPSIKKGILKISLKEHSKDSYLVEAYSWLKANDGTTDIPPHNGKEPFKPINCKLKDKFWLRDPENRKQCKKYDICYKPLHFEIISFGLCKKTTLDAAEFENYDGFRP